MQLFKDFYAYLDADELSATRTFPTFETGHEETRESHRVERERSGLREGWVGSATRRCLTSKEEPRLFFAGAEGARALEDYLGSELHNPCRVGRRGLEECCAPETIVYRAELSMVENIK